MIHFELPPLRPASPDIPASWLPRIAIAVAVAYFLAARLGLALVTQPGHVAVFWPAAGIAAGALLSVSRSAMPVIGLAVLVATLGANALEATSPLLAIGFACIHVVEAAIIAALMSWWFGPGIALDRIGRILGFVAATMVGCAVAALLASLSLLVATGVDGSSLPVIWTTWFKSDVIGVVAVAPLVMAIASLRQRGPDRLEAIEGTAVLVTLIVAGTYVFLLPQRIGALPVASPPAVVFPLLLWLAARSPPLFSAAASFAIAMIVVVTTTNEIGRFADTSIPLEDRALAAQLSIFTATFCALALSALFEDRRRAERLLQQNKAQLHRALRTGRIAAFEWLREGDTVVRMELSEGGHGSTRVDRDTYLAAIDTEDRARVAATISTLTADAPSYSITYRYRPQPDRMVWLEESGAVEFAADGSALRLTGLARDVTERVHADQRQRRLIDELNHRVKNVLAVISAIIERSRERHGAVDDYVAVLRGRLGAMTRTHARLSRSAWSGVELAQIAADELGPLDAGHDIRMTGPSIRLRPEAAQAMTLVLHELTTNAAKYGALAAPGGSVELSWRLNDPGTEPAILICDWVETVREPLKPLGPDGYGTMMIRNLVTHELGGHVELDYRRDGLRCTMTLPAAEVVDETR